MKVLLVFAFACLIAGSYGLNDEEVVSTLQRVKIYLQNFFIIKNHSKNKFHYSKYNTNFFKIINK